MEAAFGQLVHAASENWFFTMIGVISIVGIVFGTIQKTVRYTSRERTRREIAAYIAEGSITPEQGERIMKAGKSTHDAV